MNILGLNVFHADSSACLVKDGKIVSAVEEERFTRVKHYAGFPINSIKFCLDYSKLSIENIDYIAVNFDTKYNFSEKLKYVVSKNPLSILKKFLISYKKQSINKIIGNNFSKLFRGKIINVPHHVAHVASSFLCSGFENAIGLSIDGSGDFSTLECYDCKKNNFKLLNKINYPHSLGIFYQAFTQYLGFRNYGDEYKMMGLASYGKPVYVKKILNNLITTNENSFELNLKYFTHHTSDFSYYFENGIPVFEDLFSSNITNLFGRPRERDEAINNFHKDLAASVQEVFEMIIIKYIKNISKIYNPENLVLSGGCSFNSVLNGKLEKLNLFKNIYISSNVGDAGGAVGAALYASNKFDKDFVNKKVESCFFGSQYSNSYIDEQIIKTTNLNSMGINYLYLKNNDELCDKVSEYLAKKKIVGWFQDRMEWGPRALGNRSILAHPQDPAVRDKINLMIKNREDFRPFAPAIIDEFVNKYIDTNQESLFMNYVSDAKNIALQEIGGTVHTNKTCRYQSVKKGINAKFYKLLEKFHSKSGLPVLLNTSLNMNEPICENPSQAFNFFAKSSLDILVLQNWIFEKK